MSLLLLMLLAILMLLEIFVTPDSLDDYLMILMLQNSFDALRHLDSFRQFCAQSVDFSCFTLVTPELSVRLT